MKINFKVKEKIKTLSFLFICLFIFLFQINSPILNALSMDTYQTGLVTEELRLKIPSEFKKYGFRLKKKFGSLGYLFKMVFWVDKYFGIKKRKKL